MNTNEIGAKELSFFPKEIRYEILKRLPTELRLVDQASRNQVYQDLQSETNLKIGLYGKSLILEGLMLMNGEFKRENDYKKNTDAISDQIIYLNDLKTGFDSKIEEKSKANSEWKSVVQNLFCNAINYPEGYSKGSLQKLSYTSGSADAALNQLNELSELKTEKTKLQSEVSELLEKANQKKKEIVSKSIAEYEIFSSSMKSLREMRKAENIIYDLCGGKTKFNELPIVVLDPNNINSWSYGKGWVDSLLSVMIPGKSIVRGLTPDGRPFLGVRWKENRGESSVASFFQRNIHRSEAWGLGGGGVGLLENYCSDLSKIMTYSTFSSKKIEIAYQAFKQLLTTGSCNISPNDPSKAVYKLCTENIKLDYSPLAREFMDGTLALDAELFVDRQINNKIFEY